MLFKVGKDKKKFVTVIDAVDRSGRADGQPTRKDKRRAMYSPRAEVRAAEESGVAVAVRTVEATKASAPQKKVTKSSGAAPKGFYRQVNKVKYDNHALLAMDAIMASKGSINKADAESLLKDVQDGKGVTAIELGTLEFVLNGGGGKYSYVCDADAKSFLASTIAQLKAKSDSESGAR